MTRERFGRIAVLVLAFWLILFGLLWWVPSIDVPPFIIGFGAIATGVLLLVGE